jgi:hypothetical protein
MLGCWQRATPSSAATTTCILLVLFGFCLFFNYPCSYLRCLQFTRTTQHAKHRHIGLRHTDSCQSWDPQNHQPVFSLIPGRKAWKPFRWANHFQSWRLLHRPAQLTRIWPSSLPPPHLPWPSPQENFWLNGLIKGSQTNLVEEGFHHSPPGQVHTYTKWHSTHSRNETLTWKPNCKGEKRTHCGQAIAVIEFPEQGKS